MLETSALNGIRCLRRLLFTTLGLAALAVPAMPLAAQDEAVFGSAGEIYTARVDAFGKLFPGNSGVDPTHPVLALEVQYPGSPAKRWLVPETDGSEVESAPTLLYEDASHTLFIAWEAWDVYPALKLAGFDGREWGDPVTVIGNPWALKTSPQISVTHDAYQLPGETEARDRTILHLLWEEENGAGFHETYYSPILFENGAFSGSQSPVYYLGDFEDSDAPAGKLGVNLIPVSRLVPGKHSQSLIIAFASAETGRFVNLEVEVLPEQLGRLSDDARMHIIDLGARYSYPSGYKQVADFARMHIIDLGAKGFQPEVAQAMAQQVADLILENRGADPIQAIADQARMHIIDLGAKLSDRGLLINAASATTQIRQLPGSLSLTESAHSPHLLSFRVVAAWPAPEINSGLVRFFPAKSGSALLVAWTENGKVKYRETQGADWSATREIALSGTVDAARAYRILEERMSQR